MSNEQASPIKGCRPQCAVLVNIVLLAACLFTQMIHAEEPIHANQPNSAVSLCVDPDWWPFEAINEHGQHTGIAADLIALVTSRVNLPVTLHVTRTWEESVAASKAGKCQLASFINQTPERERWLIFTEPLLIDPNVLIVREDAPPFGALDKLKGYSIAIPKDSAIYERVKKDFPNLKLIGTGSEYEAFGMVSNRQADMTLRSRIVAGENIKKKGWFNLKIANEVPGYENRLRMGVLKSETGLRSLLNQGIATLTHAERENIINRHVEIKMVTAVKIDYTPVIWLAALLIAVITTSALWMIRLRKLNAKLKELSVTDALTGLYNRTGLASSFQRDIERALRYNRPLSVILLDLDHFKLVNDNFGHLTGDKVLIEFAGLIQKTVRQADAIYRWGGEEFLIICHETSPEQVHQLAERILEKVRNYSFPTGKPMSVSAGIATLCADDTMETLTRRADEMLYRAKETGRDRICIAPMTSSSATAGSEDLMNFVQLVWHSAYECGNATIDNQHRALFIRINHLLAIMLAGKSAEQISESIDVLIRDVVQHFKDEEAIIEAAGFADAVEHAQQHQHLVAKAGELVGLFHAGKLGFAQLFDFLAHDVIARHMLIEDKKFFPVVQAR